MDLYGVRCNFFKSTDHGKDNHIFLIIEPKTDELLYENDSTL